MDNDTRKLLTIGGAMVGVVLLLTYAKTPPGPDRDRLTRKLISDAALLGALLIALRALLALAGGAALGVGGLAAAAAAGAYFLAVELGDVVGPLIGGDGGGEASDLRAKAQAACQAYGGLDSILEAGGARLAGCRDGTIRPF